jgi:hypothetical protein
MYFIYCMLFEVIDEIHIPWCGLLYPLRIDGYINKSESEFGRGNEVCVHTDNVCNQQALLSDSWPLKMRPIHCAETLVNNYHTLPHYISEERRSHQHRGGSLVSFWISSHQFLWEAKYKTVFKIWWKKKVLLNTASLKALLCL